MTETLLVQTMTDLMTVRATVDILAMEDSVTVFTSFFKYRTIPTETNPPEIGIT